MGCGVKSFEREETRKHRGKRRQTRRAFIELQKLREKERERETGTGIHTRSHAHTIVEDEARG